MKRNRQVLGSREPNHKAALLLLSLVGIAGYLNSLHVPFVFDDLASIEQNAGVRLGGYFSGPLLWTRSLLFLTFALNHKYGGMEVWGYHLVNVVVHILNGALVFFIARRVFSKTDVTGSRLTWMAGLAASLFLIHPVQTESVTYVSSRSELLATFFYALAFLVFIHWPERRIGFLAAAIVSVLFILGLGFKETIISLPAALLVYDFILISKSNFRPLLERWRFYIVFLVLGIAGSIRLLHQWKIDFAPDPTLLSPWHYVLTQLRVIVRYVQVLVLPVDLNLDYDFRHSTSLFEPSVLFCLVVVSAFIGAALYWRRSRAILAFSILWFFATLAPTSSVVPIQDVIFEHRLYLPLVGLCLAFPLLVRSKIAGCAILGMLLIGTIYRNYTWGDEVRLYSDIVAKSPGKPRAYNALILAYSRRGEVDKAMSVAREGIANVPAAGKYELFTMLGNLNMQTLRYEDAIASYTQAVAGNDSAVVYNNMGMAYRRLWEKARDNRMNMAESDFQVQKTKLLSEAARAFLESYRLDNSIFTSLDSYIDIRYAEGSTEQWATELARMPGALESFDIQYSLAKLAWLEGRFADAIPYFQRAMRLNAGHKLLHFNYAYALAQTNSPDEAIREYQQAVRLDPDFLEAHYNVALLYMNAGDTRNALAHFDEILRLNPNHEPTLAQVAKLRPSPGS